jgi:heat shock protein HtpX
MNFKQNISKNKSKTYLFVFFSFLLLGIILFAIFWLGSRDILACITTAPIIGFVIICILYFNSRNITLKMANAKEISHDQSPQLYNVVEELSIALGMPVPKVYIVNDDALNAFACGTEKKGAICFTTGILEVLNREEIQGVAGHELSHLKNGDSRLMTVVASVGLIIGFISQIASWFMWFGGSRRSNNDSGGIVAIAALIVSILAIILAPILSVIIQATVSRKREWMADDTSVSITRNPAGLRRALEKLSISNTAPQGSSSTMSHLWISEPTSVDGKSAMSQSLGRMFASNKKEDDKYKDLDGNGEIDGFEEIKDRLPKKSSILDSHPPLILRINHLQAIETGRVKA